MTVSAMQKDHDVCIAIGFFVFISKPIDRNKIYLVLIQHLKPSTTFKRENIVNFKLVK